MHGETLKLGTAFGQVILLYSVNCCFFVLP